MRIALPALYWFFFIFPLFGEYDPIALYLTWQNAPDTTMTIQWITPLDRLEDLVEYQLPGDSSWKQAIGKHAPLPEKSPYFLHSVELTSLLPNTDYRFRTGQDAVVYKFRTMPSTLTNPIRFIVGGDMYQASFELLKSMNQLAARFDPMFVLVGGDLAYSDRSSNLNKKMSRWIEWLMAWKQQMVTSTGRLIPLIPAIGNHDVHGGYKKRSADAPFFYALFPMPGVAGYNALDFGKYLSVFFLDSGHTNSIEGAQTSWLENALKQRQAIPHKLALYHVPAYPSVRDFKGEISTKIRKHWVPLFEGLGIAIAFENHDHAYKRTFLLKQGKLDGGGVLYIGDGGWAVDKPRTPHKSGKSWYLAKSSPSRNFVLVILHENLRHLIAIDDKGVIIDEVVNQRNSPIPVPQSKEQSAQARSFPAHTES